MGNSPSKKARAKVQSGSKMTLNPDINECNIYEGGELIQITSENLIGNETAIKQLINNYNLKVKEATDLRETVSNLNAELLYLRTSPFIAIVSALINLCGTVIVGFAINLLTQKDPPKYSGWVLLVGCLIVIIGSISTILYPWARKWFNSKKITDVTS